MNWIFFGLGLIVGLALSLLYFRKGTEVGTLEVNYKDSDKDVYTFDINNFAALDTKDRIVLRVKRTR